MKKMRLIAAVLSAFLIAGCTQPAPAEETDFKLTDVYTELAEDNSFTVIGKEDLKPLIENGTSVLFLGFPECTWCQAYLPMLDDILKEQGAHAEYYNIYTDKSEDRPFYDEIAAMIDAKDESILSYGSDGKRVIYMPLVLFLDGGELIGFDHETCTEDSSVIKPEEYWTEEKKSAFVQRMTGYVSQIKAAQDAINAKGCDNHGCKVGD